MSNYVKSLSVPRTSIFVIAVLYCLVFEEHRAVEMLVIPDVLKSERTTPEFAGRVKVFGELIDHHATEEEDTMFKMARKVFSADELAQLDDDYTAWKASAQGKQIVETAMKDFAVL